MKIFTKISLLCVAMLYAATSVSAQDIIVKNNDNNEELQVKVLEVTDNTVKYKMWTYQDGPTFSIATNNISVIKFQNGEEQQFSQKPQQKKSILTAKKETEEVIETSTKKTTSEDNPYAKGETTGGIEIAYYFPDSGVNGFAMTYDITFGAYIINNLYAGGGLGVISSYAREGSGKYSTKTTSTALSIPTKIGYILPITKTFCIDINTGPRLNYTIAGKIESDGETTKFKDIENLKRFEAHWGFSLGLKLKGFLVGGKCLVSMREGGGEIFGIYIGLGF